MNCKVLGGAARTAASQPRAAVTTTRAATLEATRSTTARTIYQCTKWHLLFLLLFLLFSKSSICFFIVCWQKKNQPHEHCVCVCVCTVENGLKNQLYVRALIFFKSSVSRFVCSLMRSPTSRFVCSTFRFKRKKKKRKETQKVKKLQNR